MISFETILGMVLVLISILFITALMCCLFSFSKFDTIYNTIKGI